MEVQNAVGEGINDVVRTVAEAVVSDRHTGTGATYPRGGPAALRSLHNCHGPPIYGFAHTQPTAVSIAL